VVVRLAEWRGAAPATSPPLHSLPVVEHIGTRRLGQRPKKRAIHRIAEAVGFHGVLEPNRPPTDFVELAAVFYRAVQIARPLIGGCPAQNDPCRQALDFFDGHDSAEPNGVSVTGQKDVGVGTIDVGGFRTVVRHGSRLSAQEYESAGLAFYSPRRCGVEHRNMITLPLIPHGGDRSRTRGAHISAVFVIEGDGVISCLSRVQRRESVGL
jgi:hypothetical protein